MAKQLRTATGVREIEPGLFELRVQAGKDPVTGRYREVTRRFYGSLREAKTARAEFLAQVRTGRHLGTNVTVDELVTEWLKELERKDRSPRTIDEYRRRYEHDIKNALGGTPVSKVTTKMLTDLYGAHQQRGAAPGSVRKIHATISSMMSQACKWGWRDNNPAEWADPPPLDNAIPVVPTPDEVLKLMDEAKQSQRPAHSEIIYFTATTGVRRGELCAIRISHLDLAGRSVTIARAIVKKERQKVDRPTKNRRQRVIAIDNRCANILARRISEMERNAAIADVNLCDDPYVFTANLTGSEPWDPDMITQYFSRLRKRVGLDHLQFKGLRRFMDTYGQELGFSMAQVAVRAGHDPAVAGSFYTGKVDATDRELANALSHLLEPETGISDRHIPGEFRGFD